MAKIGVFGGTFNPIHIGHLMIAEEARRAAGLDRVLFVPTGESYLKDPAQIAPKGDRLEMVRRAIAGSERFAASDIEVRREGPSYTFETLEELRGQRPGDELWLILGADSLLELERWRAPERILGLAGVLAMTRGGVNPDGLRAKAEELARRFGADIRVLPAFSLTLSSSQLRELIRGGHAFRYLVTDPVWRYIRENGLYGCPEE